MHFSNDMFSSRTAVKASSRFFNNINASIKQAIKTSRIMYDSLLKRSKIGPLYPFVRYVGCCVVIDMHGSHYATFRAENSNDYFRH